MSSRGSAGAHGVLGMRDFAAEENGEGGPGAHLSITAAISAGFDSLRTMMHTEQAERRRKFLDVWPMQLQPQSFTLPGSGAVNLTIDLPEIMGPRDGYAWDIRWLRFGTSATSGSFAGATIQAHRDQTASATAYDQNEILEATSNSTYNFSSGSVVLLPGSRIVYQAVATSMTSANNVMCYGSYIQVPLDLLGEYLL